VRDVRSVAPAEPAEAEAAAAEELQQQQPVQPQQSAETTRLLEAVRAEVVLRVSQNKKSQNGIWKIVGAKVGSSLTSTRVRHKFETTVGWPKDSASQDVPGS